MEAIDMDDDNVKRDHDDEPVRQGDILGLGGTAVPKSSDEPSTSYEKEITRNSESIRHQDEDRREADDTAYRRSSGATGIDMGAGGSGTDVE
jgi:hypothetical protein